MTEPRAETPPEPAAPDVPPPPADPRALLGWAAEHDVLDRLDDLIIGPDGAPDATLPGRPGERLTYRDVLVTPEPKRGGREPVDTVREVLYRLAQLRAQQRARAAWLHAHGRWPGDETLAALAQRLQTALRVLEDPANEVPLRPSGTYEPEPVRLVTAPVPSLRYRELPLVRSSVSALQGADAALSLLEWNDGPLIWTRTRGETVLPGAVAPALQRSALSEMLAWLRDPRQAAEHERLAELLRLPAWRLALGTLDERMARWTESAGAVRVSRDERIAFRVARAVDGGLSVEPMVQKRLPGGGFSRGAVLPWFKLGERRDLGEQDQRAVRAHDDRFARTQSRQWSTRQTPAQVFGVLQALADHPAVFLHDDSVGTGRTLAIRQGRLRLRFATAAGGQVAPYFELGGSTLEPAAAAAALADDRHLLWLREETEGAAELLLALLDPRAATLIRAFALVPTSYPPEAHDALAARLEPLQEVLDIEFPSTWTRTIAPADARLVVRLERLAAGALAVRLGVRPVVNGAVFAPGEGPALLLDGRGSARHGLRRDIAAEREAARRLGEQLGLDAGVQEEPWLWRLPGEAALAAVFVLAEMGEQVVVEWANDDALVALGTARGGDLRLRVVDHNDWFELDGEVRPRPRRGAPSKAAPVPLATLLAAIREERRYVPVGPRGFLRIEETLRRALAGVEAQLDPTRNGLRLPRFALLGGDPLRGLVELQAQVEASAAWQTLQRQLHDEGAPNADETAPTPHGTTLRPYQHDGITWLLRLARWGAGAVLADEMGLGKTIQTLMVLRQRAGRGPALVVTPTSVMRTWVDEAARFAPDLRVHPHHGSGRAQRLTATSWGPGDLIVTSYAVAALDSAALSPIAFSTLVLDEAQAIKNATTVRAQALRQLKAEWRLALTGTPIENHLADLWSVFRIVSPGLFGSWEEFRGRYAVPIEKFSDEQRRDALAERLRPFVLRRTKAQVARDLPPRTEITRLVTLSPEERALYDQLRAATVEEIRRRKQEGEGSARDIRFILLAALTRLRQLCCDPRLVYPSSAVGSSKAEHATDLLVDLREQGHKTLVFSQFRSFLELVAPRLRRRGLTVLSLDGTTPVPVREQRIAAFTRGEADVFLISLKAGGFGLNLTAADTVVHLDPWWNPAVTDQATARAHRIGQPAPVTAIKLVASDTVEEAVLRLHDSKRKLAAGVLHGTELASRLSPADLIALITSN